jgi:Skp family chaperone for outer membrane proteins
MRLVNRRAALAAVILATAALGGCSHVDVHSESIRGVAYVRVDDVIKANPLFPQLQQLNDAIAAINLEAALPQAPLTPAQIAAQTKILNAELQAAQQRANAIIQSKQQSYEQQEHDADVAAVKAAGIDPAAAGLGQQMNVTSQAQAQQAAQAAQQGYAQYQRSVVAQDNAALLSIEKQLSKQADDKYRARAEQYQQDENDLSLSLAQQDAPQRMSLQTKMNTLALSADQRKAVTDQLNALNQKETDAVNAMRAQHAASLAAYRKQLTAETTDDIRKQQATVQSQTTAKLSQRRQQVGAELRGLGAAPVPTGALPPDLRQKLAQIHQIYASKFQADAQQAVVEYNQTKDDLDRQFEALHGENVGATGAAAKQLQDLQKRHDALQAQIQAQIQRDAVALAKKMGFTVVFDNVQAANGGYDMTNDLIHLESQHE